MVTIPRGVNPFIAGNLYPQLAQAPVMAPTPMAQPQMFGAPMIRQPQIQPAPVAPAPQADTGGGGLAALGGNIGNFLGGDPALAWAAGVLGGGPTGEAMGRGFSYALAAKQAKEKQQTPTATSDINNYLFAKQNGFTGTFQDWLAQGAGNNANRRALQPTWMRDQNGNWVPGQLTQSGVLEATQMPEGMTAVPPADVTGARQTATVDAKTAGAARAALPAAEQAVAITRQTVDALRNDAKGQADQFGRFLGVIPQQWTPAMPGTPKANFRVNLEQASGQAFMQARQMLKGGGQITDFEGRRGEAAYSRMMAAAGNGDQQSFLTALDDFEQAVEAGYQKLQAAAQGGYTEGAVRDRGGAPPSSGWQIEEVQ